jgi:CDP-diacylglycerol pyrophosphatase
MSYRSHSAGHAVKRRCAAVAMLLLAAASPAHAQRDALWRIVHDGCVPDEEVTHDPKPCVRVDLSDGVERGFAVLKDIRGNTQYLLIPTRRLPGIESPVVLSPDAPNYFADAWEARTYIDSALHGTLPRDDFGLAINSAVSRSQDQLHIHVDCVRPDVQMALHEHEGAIGARWRPFPISLSGKRYFAMWVPGEELGPANPFRLLAAGLPGAREDMGDRTLVVIGLTRADGTVGFVILEDQVDEETHDRASGEDLLDHACRIGKVAPPAN